MLMSSCVLIAFSDNYLYDIIALQCPLFQTLLKVSPKLIRILFKFFLLTWFLSSCQEIVEYKIVTTSCESLCCISQALWYTEERGQDGPIFGGKDQWKGLGVFFDSYDNDQLNNNPYIMIILNDGTQQYNHER